MDARINCNQQDNPLRVRCYVTGKTDIDRVCHNCGRAMHNSVETFEPLCLRWRRLCLLLRHICWRPRHRFSPLKYTCLLLRYLYKSLKLLYENQEFSNLDLDLEHHSVGIGGSHCQYCIADHYHHSRIWQFLFVATALISFLEGYVAAHTDYLSSKSILAITFLMVFAISLSIVGFLTEFFSYKQILLTNRPPFPILGQSCKLTVKEQLRGNIRLYANGIYESNAWNPKGELDFSIRLTSKDFARLNLYKGKFHLLSGNSVNTHAGFIIFDSKIPVEFNHSQEVVQNQINTTVLQKRLAPLSQEQNWDWNVHDDYAFSQNTYIFKTLTIQIIPVFINEGPQTSLDKNSQMPQQKSQYENPRTTLELTIQLHPYMQYLYPSDTEDPMIHDLQLYYPEVLGDLKAVRPLPIPETRLPSNQTIQVRWKNIELRAEKDKEEYYPHVIVYLRFAENIKANMELYGYLTVRFPTALSGIKNVRFFDSIGRRRDPEKTNTKIYTDIKIKFRLSLNSLCIRNSKKMEDSLYLEIPPTYNMVALLTESISSIGAYVQRVIENFPQTDAGHAQIVNRYWDITGRYYTSDGIFPIDFHIILIGKEIHEKYLVPKSGISEENYGGIKKGSTKIEINVQAITHDNEMNNKIDSFFKDLMDIAKNLPIILNSE